MNNDAYGGFVVSKNILKGIPVRYTYREPSAIKQLNGWHLLSEQDDDVYIRKSENFEIVSASTIESFCPLILVLFDAPYGTDLFWKYKDGVVVGFYDLKKERDTTVNEILRISEDEENG